MKIKELFEDINKKPHVFLDMDGVQCDLAGALQEAIGVSHYEAKEKTEDEIERLAWVGKSVEEFQASTDPMIQFAIAMFETDLAEENKSKGSIRDHMTQACKIRPALQKSLAASLSVVVIVVCVACCAFVPFACPFLLVPVVACVLFVPFACFMLLVPFVDC
jgi:hypothetical protein